MLSTVQILVRLKRLRVQIEEDCEGLSDEQACLLVDVCEALGIDRDADKFYVVGEAFNSVVLRPILFRLTEDSELVKEFVEHIDVTVAPRQAGEV